MRGLVYIILLLLSYVTENIPKGFYIDMTLPNNTNVIMEMSKHLLSIQQIKNTSEYTYITTLKNDHTQNEILYSTYAIQKGDNTRY